MKAGGDRAGPMAASPGSGVVYPRQPSASRGRASSGPAREAGGSLTGYNYASPIDGIAYLDERRPACCSPAGRTRDAAGRLSVPSGPAAELWLDNREELWGTGAARARLDAQRRCGWCDEVVRTIDDDGRALTTGLGRPDRSSTDIDLAPRPGDVHHIEPPEGERACIDAATGDLWG